MYFGGRLARGGWEMEGGGGGRWSHSHFITGLRFLCIWVYRCTPSRQSQSNFGYTWGVSVWMYGWHSSHGVITELERGHRSALGGRGDSHVCIDESQSLWIFLTHFGSVMCLPLIFSHVVSFVRVKGFSETESIRWEKFGNWLLTCWMSVFLL